ncbi:MAG: bifunctional diaminohydroxyphosphoribosylaminopyrimidine deaminase/5-amino-6-(5-phosphoribosylamino)uracil reductase RibD [Rhodospirillales bacterium]|nr:bifunctional diaminohydroxyphosphoribosylaminopyrimidine deaminase/5-amino-6-(5-phosphoribosylamino)uracil reductase RibD [Rhodospirillales bacterium]
MQAAFALARRGLGLVAPNPAVGCVLVRPDLDGRVVGRGWTQPGGRPHAETEALGRAGALAEGATAYVTLEPCSHQGETGPCAEALIQARVARVVIAMQDPDPRVSGRGISKLEAAGIIVSVGLLEPAARQINSGFIYKIQFNRPVFSWKTATSLDGKIATASGHSKWITGPQARRAGHLLRAGHDAILIGIGTALADDPDLTCRLPGLDGASPVRLVVDSQLRLPLTHKLVRTAVQQPTWVCTTASADPQKQAALRDAGVTLLVVDADGNGQLDTLKLAETLAENGLTRVLIEGGARLSTSFLAHDLIDHIYWFRAPLVIGSDGLSATHGLDISQIDDITAFTRRRSYDMGPDRLEVLNRNQFAT